MQNMNVLIHICAQIKELQSTIFKAILLPIYLFIGKNKSLAIPYVLKYYGIDIADSFAFWR